MNIEAQTTQNLLKLASLRFKTIVAETRENQPLTLSLPTEAGIQGFIVILQPGLPSIY